MQVVINTSKLGKLADNNIFSGFLPKLNNSKIIFYGANNMIICEDGVTIEDSVIEFGANNSIIFLSKNKFCYKLNLKIFNNSNVFIGHDTYFNEQLNAVISEGTNLIIGKDCMFSFGVHILTTDHHLIYDINTLQRTNYSKSIYIGDHVWIGQQSTILKGSKIDSGCIIGACTVVANKTIEKNSCYAGNPAVCIKRGVMWDGTSTHKWTEEETEKYANYGDLASEKRNSSLQEYIFSYDDEKSLNFHEIDKYLSSPKESRVSYLTWLSKNDNKNRFVNYDQAQLNLESSLDNKNAMQRNRKNI